MRMFQRVSRLFVCLCFLASVGCTDDAPPPGVCPPDYPVERAGACYRADGGVVPGDAAMMMCTGTHPLFDATRRWCATGFCYCGDGATLDVCYPAASAVACCPRMPTCD